LTCAPRRGITVSLARSPPTKGALILMQTKHRLLLAVIIGTLLAAPLSIALAASAGKDYSRCVNACIATRQACSARCPDECSTMFPNDPDARSACLSECKDTCVSAEKECKDRCLAVKKGEHPTEP
jgi:hypothetical protein